MTAKRGVLQHTVPKMRWGPTHTHINEQLSSPSTGHLNLSILSEKSFPGETALWVAGSYVRSYDELPWRIRRSRAGTFLSEEMSDSRFKFKLRYIVVHNVFFLCNFLDFDFGKFKHDRWTLAAKLSSCPFLCTIEAFFPCVLLWFSNFNYMCELQVWSYPYFARLSLQVIYILHDSSEYQVTEVFTIRQ